MRKNVKSNDNWIFNREVTIKICKDVYGFDLVNVLGETQSDQDGFDFFGKFRESWVWMVEIHLEYGFSVQEIRDYKIEKILKDEH